MPITITYRPIIIGILLLILSYSSLATEPSNLIKDITFSLGDKGEGIVTISLPNKDISPIVQEKAGKVIVNLPNTALPELLQKEITLAEYKTPAQTINATANNQNTIISILPKGYYDYSAYQLNDTLVITLWKTSKKPIFCIENNDKFINSDYIFLNLPNTEIRTILQTITDYKEMNLSMNDSIKGKMTIRMHNMPWEQALDIILNTNNLYKILDGNTLTVYDEQS